ncbi:SufI Putative multicopper oxidases [Spirosomataceae bacterium]|jgi:blue copper oxidase
MNRNEFLKKLGFGSVMAFTSESLLSSCMANMDHGGTVAPQTITDGEFKNILKIPETITGTTALTAQNTIDTLAGAKVNVLGYRNGLLGPTIRVQKGEIVNMSFQNKMAEHTNVHWHGLVIPANMDGHPDQMVMPNESFNFQFTINQQAGINWYHPHLHQLTGKQVTQGLAGLFIIESPEEKVLNLPSGNYEIPLIIQDKRFNADGTIKYSPTMMEVMNGYLGDNILVNGTAKPYFEVATRFYRFRVLNGSSARIYNLTLSNGADFYVIGSDGGILQQPEKVKNLMLGSGERADILIDFSSVKVGEMVYLTNETFSTMGTAQGTQTFKIMSFNVTKQETDTFKLSTALISVPKTAGSSKTRTFALTMDHGAMSAGGMHKISGKVYKSDRIDEKVPFGATEIWEFDNSTGDEPHPMHIHGVQFQVVSRSGGRNTILPHEKGWKDTVLVAPKEKVQVIMKFEQKGKFVFHCHNLEHEDDGMMLNFEVK